MSASTKGTKKSNVDILTRTEEVKVLNAAVINFRDKWGRVQTNFHNYLKNDPIGSTIIASSFDTGLPEKHTHAFVKLAEIVQIEFDRETVQEVVDLWSNAVRVWIAKSTKTKLFDEQMSLFGSGYILTGILMTCGDCYKALQIMIDLIRMRDTNPRLTVGALSLALDLGEFELFAELKKLVSLKTMTNTFQYWLASLDCCFKMKFSKPNVSLLCKEVYNKLANPLNVPKTYATSYAEIALRDSLVYAAKQPNAPIQLLGDPIYHTHRCYDVIYNCFNGLFGNAVQKNDSMQMFADEKPSIMLDKCYLFYKYCHITSFYINEMFNCGMTTEAEHRFVPYYKFALFSAVPYRLLSASNLFFSMRWRVALQSEAVDPIREWMRQLCEIEYDWMLQQEQVYSRTLIADYAYNSYRELIKLRNSSFQNQFGRQKVVKFFKDRIKVKSLPTINNPFQSKLLPICYAENLIRATTQFFMNCTDSECLPEKKKHEVIEEMLQTCKSAEVSCRAQWLLLQHFFRVESNRPQFSWINKSETKRVTRSAAAKRHELIDEDFKREVLEAYVEYKSFQHLFYFQWRKRCASYVAANVEQVTQSSRPYHIAMLLTESMSIALRSTVRVRETERVEPKRLAIELSRDNLDNVLQKLTLEDKENSETKVEENLAMFPCGYFDGSKAFSDFIEGLPADITVLQFAFDSNDVLWLVRYHRDHEPFSIPLCYIRNAGIISSEDDKATDPIFDRLYKLLQENEASAVEKDNLPQKFWKKRRDLNVQNLVADAQDSFFGKLWPLCRPFGPKATQSLSAAKVRSDLEKAGLSRASSTILTHLIDQIDKDEWTELLHLLAERETNLIPESLEQLKFSTLRVRMGSRKRRCAGESYVFLMLPPSLSPIPWECMPVFQDRLVSRIPSIHTLKALLVKHELMPKPVNARNSYYVLDPAGNLPSTQERLQNFVSEMKWQGVTGQAPRKEDLVAALCNQDMYVYLGHGSGRKYIGGTREFKKLDCRSVCLLMGCSSVEITQEGQNYDGRSAVYDFMLAHCPCLVGCLWLVTDGEVDRFFLELMNFCFKELQIKADGEQEEELGNQNSGVASHPETPKNLESKKPERSDIDAYRFIMRGIAKARLACKLPYLTGGSVVSYGLPTFAQY